MCIQTAFCSFCVRRISMEIKNYISEILCFPDYEATSSVAPEMIQCEGFTEANP